MPRPTRHVFRLDRTTRDFFFAMFPRPWTPYLIEAAMRCDTMLDIGAHIGQEALLFRCFNRRGRIVCLEPNKAALEILKKNLEGLDNIETLGTALGDGAVGMMNLEAPSVQSKFVPVVDGDCHSVRLSDLVDPQMAGKLLVKFNCEGGEASVFDHEPSLQVLDAAAVVLMECHGERLNDIFAGLIASRFSQTHFVSEVWQNRRVYDYVLRRKDMEVEVQTITVIV